PVRLSIVRMLSVSIQPAIASICLKALAISGEPAARRLGNTEDTCVCTSITGYLARGVGWWGTTSMLLGSKSSSARPGLACAGAGFCAEAGWIAKAAAPVVPARKARREVLWLCMMADV